MSAATVPERISWALETMAVAPNDRLLEIGCGRGVAVALVCKLLVDGSITAIDRSEKAIAAAQQRNAAEIASGKATFHAMALEDVDLPADTFDKVFAVNVNLFWVRAATTELEHIRSLLVPSGTFYLFYEPPSVAQADGLVTRVRTGLVEAGFTVTTLTAPARASSLVCLVGRVA